MSETDGLDFEALLQIYDGVCEPEEDGSGAAMWMLPMGSLRALVAEHFELEEMRADIRELILNPDVKDSDLLLITPERAAVLEEE